MSISHWRTEVIRRGRNRKTRPKTFKSEESAVAYAKANKIAKFELKNLKTAESKTSKIVIVTK